MQQHLIKSWLVSFILLTTLLLGVFVMAGVSLADANPAYLELVPVLEESDDPVTVTLNTFPVLPFVYYPVHLVALDISISHGPLHSAWARIRGSPVL